MYQNYKRNDKDTEDYELFTKAVSEISQLIETSKDEYNLPNANSEMIPAQKQNLTGLF